MKATGIVRRIDDLGRVVIPKELRRSLKIREGDPLEIYTDKEGIIFQKYSPIGELSAFAAEYADTLHKTCSLSVLISDRDTVIATAGVSRKEYGDRTLSEAVEKLMEGRGLYVWREGTERILPIAEGGSHAVSCAMPIVAEGDVVGCVISLAAQDKPDRAMPASDVESKLIQTAAGFLGRQLES